MKMKKAIIQTAVCLALLIVYTITGMVDYPELQDKRDSAVASISKHYSVSDIKDKGKTAVLNVIKAPAVVTGFIISSKEKQEYGLPLDEPENGETGAVYAAAGGRVVETGNNDEYGNYLIIDHEDKISIYGNCDRIYVKEHEHVRKGQVIASFTSDDGKTFLYELKDSE